MGSWTANTGFINTLPNHSAPPKFNTPNPPARSLLPVDARLKGICFSANMTGVGDDDDEASPILPFAEGLTPVLVSSSNRYTISPVFVAIGMPIVCVKIVHKMCKKSVLQELRKRKSEKERCCYRGFKMEEGFIK